MSKASGVTRKRRDSGPEPTVFSVTISFGVGPVVKLLNIRGAGDSLRDRISIAYALREAADRLEDPEAQVVHAQ